MAIDSSYMPKSTKFLLTIAKIIAIGCRVWYINGMNAHWYNLAKLDWKFPL